LRLFVVSNDVKSKTSYSLGIIHYKT